MIFLKRKKTKEKNTLSVDKIAMDNKVLRLELEATKILSIIDSIDVKMDELNQNNFILLKKIEKISLGIKNIITKNM